MMNEPAHFVTEGSEEISSDQIGDGSRKESNSKLPFWSAHGIYHPDR